MLCQRVMVDVFPLKYADWVADVMATCIGWLKDVIAIVAHGIGGW